MIASIHVLPLAIGVIFLLLTIGTAFESFRLLWRGLSATGLVVGHELEEGCYREVIEFTDREGTCHRFTSRSGRGKLRHNKGSSVLVVYDPVREDRAEIRLFGNLWLFPFCFAAFAALFLAFGFGIVGRDQ